MSSFTLTAPSIPDDPPSTLTSIIFHGHLPANTVALITDAYGRLRTPEVEAMSGGEYHTTCANLVLQAYNSDEIRMARETWIHDIKQALSKLVELNKDTLKHVELILPTRDIAVPLDLFDALRSAKLESFAVQWPHREAFPLRLLPERELIPSYAAFMQSLVKFLAHQSSTLKRLRISLPQTTMQEPRTQLVITDTLLPPLPHLQILDVTHTGPPLYAIMKWLKVDTPFPALEHLILDQGGEISWAASASCDSDDEDEVLPTPTVQSLPGWQTLGYLLALQRLEGRPALKSISAALHEWRFHFGGADRVKASDLKEWLQVGAKMALKDKGREAEENPLKDLVVLTAWPRKYDLVEPHESDQDEDLHTHSEGYGHLAYPEGQRPTTGLWPAKLYDLMSWNEKEGYY